MDRNKKILSIFLVLSLITIQAYLSKITFAQDNNFLNLFGEAYKKVYIIESNGGNITEYYQKLNYSLSLFEEASKYKGKNDMLYNELIQNATNILEEVISSHPESLIFGISPSMYKTIVFVLEIASLAIIGFLFYYFIPRITLYLWFKIYAKWKVIKK